MKHIKLFEENLHPSGAKKTGDANKGYKQKCKEIDKELATLGKKLKLHNDRQSADITNWGFVGDLGYVLEKLKEMNTFISG
jgi:hypothetical protein